MNFLPEKAVLKREHCFTSKTNLAINQSAVMSPRQSTMFLTLQVLFLKVTIAVICLDPKTFRDSYSCNVSVLSY